KQILRSNPEFPRHLDISDERLYLAVRTIQGFLVMASINRNRSEENAIRLKTELATHDNQLDDFHARVEESGLRLTLGNVKAFHDDGITDADIQAVLQAISDVYLG